MQCRKAEMAIVENRGTPLPPDVQKHIRTCKDCKAFARSHRLLMQEDGNREPSSDLDEKVLEQAGRFMSDRAARTRARPILVIPAWLAAAAALAIVLAISAIMRYADRTKPIAHRKPHTEETAKPVTWQAADLDLAVIEQELDLMLDQLDAVGEPYSIGNPLQDRQAASVSAKAGGFDQALLELECDVYFEMQQLASDG